MSRIRGRYLLFAFLFLLPVCESKAQAQGGGDTAALQLGAPIARTIGRGASHGFRLNVDQGQFFQVVVDQRGIDLVVRLYSPERKLLAEFDSPNGAEGAEIVRFAALTAGVYVVEVASLNQAKDLTAGRYEIRILEVRPALDVELRTARAPETLKARGIALLSTLPELLSGVRLPQTRIRSQIQAAQLLWPVDEKLARKVVADATGGIREFMETPPPDLRTTSTPQIRPLSCVRR